MLGFFKKNVPLTGGFFDLAEKNCIKCNFLSRSQLLKFYELVFTFVCGLQFVSLPVDLVEFLFHVLI